MKQKNNLYLVPLFIFVVVFITACTTDQNGQQVPTQTVDTDSPEEIKKEAKEESPEVLEQISSEVEELLTKSERAKSMFYKYKGPESDGNFFDFFVKGNLIAYKPDTGKSYDKEDFYDTIYLDIKEETAEAYCAGQSCYYPGKKEDLKFDIEYIKTPYDWIEGITSAEKIGEERLQKRNVWKVDTNKGILWIDTFYGIPLQVKWEGFLYEFEAMAFNKVKDEEVMP